jgi:hypothetical protein
MSKDGQQSQWFAMVASLVGALTGQHELSESERAAVAAWVVGHAEVPEIRDLLVKVIMTQIIDTSEFRGKVAAEIRRRFQSEESQPGETVPRPETTG